MAKTRYGRRRRRKKGRKSTVLTISRRAARTAAFDSKVERIMARVARKVHNEEEVTLISREFLFGNHDPATHAWTGGIALDYEGTVIPLGNIPLADINISASQTTTDIPETMDDESAPAGVGIAHGSITVTKHGRRSSDFVKLKGFSFFLRAMVSRRLEATVPPLDSVVVRWRLVSVRGEDAFVQGWEPAIEQVLPWRADGYSAALDKDEQQETADLRVRILAKGRMFLRYTTLKTDLKEKTWYRKFKKPVLVKYKPGDQGGETKENVGIFLVMRASIPTNGVYDELRPRCQAVSKLFYTDN